MSKTALTAKERAALQEQIANRPNGTKLDDETRVAMVRDAMGEMTVKDVAAKYGVSEGTVYRSMRVLAAEPGE